jgi:hypothetical protein
MNEGPRRTASGSALPVVSEESPPRRATTDPGALRVVTAARAEPLQPAPEGKVSARLKENAADTALNVVAILRDTWDDFRNSDRFFKYKALILGVWLALSLAAIVVAWPEQTAPANRIGARLVTTRVTDTPVFMIVNESGSRWEDVVVVVNQRYRAAVAFVSAETPENTLTLEPRRLLGENGQPAPTTLKVTELEVRTARGKAQLIQDGRELQ